MMTRAQLAALLGLATLSPAPYFDFNEQPVYYNPDATPSITRRTERRRQIRARATTTKQHQK